MHSTSGETLPKLLYKKLISYRRETARQLRMST